MKPTPEQVQAVYDQTTDLDPEVIEALRIALYAPDWCAYCGESAAGGETVDLPSQRWIALCPRHTRQNLDRYHDGGYGAFIAAVDKMPDSFWQEDTFVSEDTIRMNAEFAGILQRTGILSRMGGAT